MRFFIMLAILALTSVVSIAAHAGYYEYGSDNRCHIFSNSGVQGVPVAPWNCQSGGYTNSGSCPAGTLANPYSGGCCAAGTLAVRGGCCPAGDGTCINGF